MFFWSTLPVTTSDEVPGQGAVISIGFTIFFAYLLNALSSVPLFVIGLVRLRRRRLLMIAWTAGALAGGWLELPLGGTLLRLVPYVPPDYLGSPIVAWGDLARAAGYLIVGAVLAHIVISARRAPARLCR
jgi:hypothetical protein